MRCILAVKMYGKKAYGHIIEPEFKEMYQKAGFFQGLWPYMENSFIMGGDYKMGRPHTIESEAE